MGGSAAFCLHRYECDVEHHDDRLRRNERTFGPPELCGALLEELHICDFERLVEAAQGTPFDLDGEPNCRIREKCEVDDDAVCCRDRHLQAGDCRRTRAGREPFDESVTQHRSGKRGAPKDNRQG